MKRIPKNIVLFFILSMCFFSSAYAEEIRVVPIGKAVGIKINTDGLLVIGTSEVNGENAAKKCGIKVNDRITEANGEAVETSERFTQIVNEHPDGINIKVVRDNQNIEINDVIIPVHIK